MKHKGKFSQHRKKFQMDSGKQYIKKFRIYPAFLYNRLDKWLKSMSAQGWHIVHCGIFSFLFEKGSPKEKEYFTYTFIPNEGRYDILLRHPCLEKTFGSKKKKSKINSNEMKAYNIVEIDLDKIDIKNNIAYKELVSDRDRLYMWYFIRNVSVVSAVVLVLIVLRLIS